MREKSIVFLDQGILDTDISLSSEDWQAIFKAKTLLESDGLLYEMYTRLIFRATENDPSSIRSLLYLSSKLLSGVNPDLILDIKADKYDWRRTKITAS